MSKVVVRPRVLQGTVTPPPSKSLSHRAIVCAGLAEGTSTIENMVLSEDIQATLRCMEELGATWRKMDASTIAVTGIGGKPSAEREELPRFDCGESGSTLRFMIPIALAVAGGGIFTGRGRLMERPEEPYFRLFEEKGIRYEKGEGALTLRGKLEAGEYALPGNVSSQFFTGLLLALPLVEGESRIISTTETESWDYVSMTVAVQKEAGIEIEARQGREKELLVKQQAYRPLHTSIEADWTQAALWYAANFLDNRVTISGLNYESNQGDKVIASHYWKLARPGDLEIDVSQCPDLMPSLAVMAALRNGTTQITNAARLRMKESDRLAAVTAALNGLGARVEEHSDRLVIRGVERLEGGVEVECRGDHRIAMMAAIAASKCKTAITLTDGECVRKSYPHFWEHYQMLGGDLDVLVSG